MAEHLASIFGTEKDRVNCPFFFKIGACRHGDRCSRIHNKPTLSQTLLMPNMYQSPATVMTAAGPSMTDPRQLQEHFEDFYEDIFEELDKFGEVENLAVCDNLADHLVGNVYVKFREEESAGAALMALQGRYYSGRPIVCEFSPVTDFRESTCRQYEENTCNRGGYCNFMHLKPISRDLKKRLFGRYKRRDDRSRSPRRDDRGRGGGGRGGREEGHHGSGGHGGGGGGADRERERERERDRDRDRRRSRSRERGGGGGDRRGGGRDDRRRGSRERDGGGGSGGRDEAPSAKGMSDEARRAMIAEWAAKAAAAAAAAPPGAAEAAGAVAGGGGADDAPAATAAAHSADEAGGAHGGDGGGEEGAPQA